MPPKSDNQKSVIIDKEDKRGATLLRGVIIGTGIAGFAIFARSIRLFTTFQHVRQIPEQFYKQQMTLNGKVTFVTEQGQLRVKHNPILRVPFSKFFEKPQDEKEKGKLTVSVAGVDLTESGCDWLKKHILLKPVWFTLIKRPQSDTVECEVFAKKGRFFKYSVNRELVRMGLASVPSLDNKQHLQSYQTNAAYSRLVHDLLICEKYADKRGVGLWHQKGRNWFEWIYSLWFQAGDAWRSNIMLRFFMAAAKFAKEFSILASRLAKIGAEKGWRLGGQVKEIYIASRHR